MKGRGLNSGLMGPIALKNVKDLKKVCRCCLNLLFIYLFGGRCACERERVSSEDNLMGVCSLYHVGSRNQTQVAKLGGKLVPLPNE